MAFLPLLFSVILSKRSNFKNLSILILSNSVIFFLVPLFTNVYILFILFYAWTVIVAMESIVDYNIAQSVTKPEIRGTQVALISTFVRIFSVFYNAMVGLLFQITPLFSFCFTGFLGILAVLTIKFAEFIGVLK